jgi:hypothetical protein
VYASQSYGAVLYTWRSGNKTQHFLALASDDKAHHAAMAGALAEAQRRKLVYQLHHETGLSFAVLYHLVRKISTYGLGMLAIGLASELLRQADQDLDAARKRAYRLKHMNNADRLANLDGYAPTANLGRGRTLEHVCRGAHAILAGPRR